MTKKLTKLTSVFIALVMALGMVAVTPVTAHAAGTTYIIDGNKGHTWEDVAPGGNLTLNDGDTLTIAASAHDEYAALNVTIHISANANVTINGVDGEPGQAFNGICIVESKEDTYQTAQKPKETPEQG